MFQVADRFADDPGGPVNTGCFNRVRAKTSLWTTLLETTARFAAEHPAELADAPG
jgi:hypothetical protein